MRLTLLDEMRAEPFTKDKTVHDPVDHRPRRGNPLGQWFAKYLPNEEMRCMSTNGIFAASREDIRKRTLEEYKMLIKTVSTENPVAVHYLERVWANVVSIDHCI